MNASLRRAAWHFPAELKSGETATLKQGTAAHRHPWLTTAALVVALACLAMGCQTAPVKQASWRQKLQAELPVLGHRNWIVIADSAYPAQTSAGVETVYTGTTQLETVKAVLAALDHAKHVRPIVHLDAEMEAVPESLAPGIEKYRAGLRELLKSRGVTVMPHDQLISKLDEAGKTFRVLILKTDLTIPYTSVFLQLDCGYWSPEAEKQLREKMAGH